MHLSRQSQVFPNFPCLVFDDINEAPARVLVFCNRLKECFQQNHRVICKTHPWLDNHFELGFIHGCASKDTQKVGKATEVSEGIQVFLASHDGTEKEEKLRKIEGSLLKAQKRVWIGHLPIRRSPRWENHHGCQGFSLQWVLQKGKHELENKLIELYSNYQDSKNDIFPQSIHISGMRRTRPARTRLQQILLHTFIGKAWLQRRRDPSPELVLLI